MSIPNKNFAGIDGFTWFFGVVENRQDPLGLGRVKVRAYGWHTKELTEIPSDDLPWASVMQGAMDRSFGTPRDSDMVFGFFTDGENAQCPVIIGIIPGYFSSKADGSGFHDMRPIDVLKNSPKKPASREYNTDGSGIVLTEIDTANNSEAIRHPNADELDESSITGLATYKNIANTVITARKNNLDKNIIGVDDEHWDEPYPAFNPRYPYNQVVETESGHVFELDDSPGSERVHIAHRTGSFIEWYPSGSKVEKITKSNYQIVMGDDHLHVMGKVQITVAGDASIRVIGDTKLQAENDLIANVSGDMKVSVGGAFDVKADSVNFDVANEFAAISGSQKLTSSGNMDVKGSAVRVGGSSVDVTGVCKIANLGAFVDHVGYQSQVNAGGTAPDAGSAAGIPSPPDRGTVSTGVPSPEVVPTPPDNVVIDFDPETAVAYIQNGYLDTNPDGTKTDPGKNAAAVAAVKAASGPCTFQTLGKTFLSDHGSWSMSSSGLALLKASEGLAKVVSPDIIQAYHDPPFSATTFAIGYGSTSVGIDQPVTAGMTITRAQAETFLQYTIAVKVLPIIKQAVTVDLTQNMVDALCDFVYNVGAGNFKKSTLLTDINNQNWCDAGYQFLIWNKSQGRVLPALTIRRAKERQLFLS